MPLKYSTNYNFALADTSDGDDVKFLTWRTALDGSQGTSNFMIIDTEMKRISDDVSNIKTTGSIVQVNGITETTNNYTATVGSFNEYTVNMLFLLSLDTGVTGNATLNINDLGERNINKYDENGLLISLVDGDLFTNNLYLMRYDISGVFVVLNSIITDKSISSSKVTDDFIAPNSNKLNDQLASYYATASSIDDIIDGTTTVGNADKLDGKQATDFAPSGFGLGTGAVLVPNNDIRNISKNGIYEWGPTILNRPTIADYGVIRAEVNGNSTWMRLTAWGLNSNKGLSQILYKWGDTWDTEWKDDINEYNILDYAAPSGFGLGTVSVPLSKDLNPLLAFGCWRFDNNTTNRPSDANYGMGVTVPYGNGWAKQIAFDAYSDIMYLRSYQESEFSPWVAYGHMSLSGTTLNITL